MKQKLQSAMTLAKVAMRRAARPGPHGGYIGFVGHQNLGDEAMFEAAIALFGPGIETLSTATVERQLAKLRLGGLKRHSLILLGGGTLINQNYLEVVEECLTAGLPLATLGTGVGSAGFSGGEQSLNARWCDLLSQFERVGVRGPRSLAKLRAIGVEKAEVVGDLALALTPDEPLCEWQAKRLLFNTCAARTVQDAEHLAAFDNAIVPRLGLLRNSGWDIVPIAFHEEDVGPITKVMQKLGLAESTVELPLNFSDYTSLARTASGSISVRLHASVLAAMCGVPNLLLGYRDKCHDFCESIDMPEAVIDYSGDLETELDDKIEWLIHSPQTTGLSMHSACLSFRQGLQDYASGVLRGAKIKPTREGSRPN